MGSVSMHFRPVWMSVIVTSINVRLLLKCFRSKCLSISSVRFQRLSRDEKLLRLVYFYDTNRSALAWDRKKPVY